MPRDGWQPAISTCRLSAVARTKWGTRGTLRRDADPVAGELWEVERKRQALEHELREHERAEAENRLLALGFQPDEQCRDRHRCRRQDRMVNDAFVALAGYTLAEVVGRRPGPLLQGPIPTPPPSRRSASTCAGARHSGMWKSSTTRRMVAVTGSRSISSRSSMPKAGCSGTLCDRTRHLRAQGGGIRPQCQPRFRDQGHRIIAGRLLSDRPELASFSGTGTSNASPVAVRVDGKANPPDLFAGNERRTIADAIHRVYAEGEVYAEASLVSTDGRSTPHYFSGLRYGNQWCAAPAGRWHRHQRAPRRRNALRASEGKFSAAINGSPRFHFRRASMTGASPWSTRHLRR